MQNNLHPYQPTIKYQSTLGYKWNVNTVIKNVETLPIIIFVLLEESQLLSYDVFFLVRFISANQLIEIEMIAKLINSPTHEILVCAQKYKKV